ncbi:MAG TPA: acetaldehyde dehydrogenase (acetylating) [Feifaniaceae bacterium]|nr:acetaldehyde dehydrogenase (acetylating) [Feifaniaceae bacterium]
MSHGKIKAAIIGPGNIGMDLMYKIRTRSRFMQLDLVTGIMESKGIALAREEGFDVSTEGIQAVLARPDIKIVFDATLASAHQAHAPLLKAAGKKAIDLTPAAVGKYVVPTVNMEQNLDADNINLITCGGQATIPIVYAISRAAEITYAEIVATIASKSAGIGTRESIDEFTQTTARGLCEVGRARRSKAIILLNPAEPPMIMNNTIYCTVKDADEGAVTRSVLEAVEKVKKYVPGYRLKIPPIFEGDRVTVMVEVEGAGDYLPKYSGNLDIETSAAVAVAERIAERLLASGAGEAV